MRVALINLPHPVPVVRRYMCSYNSPIFLFPPLELLYVGGVVREWSQDEVLCIDAIAERLSRETLLERLRAFAPDLVVSLPGFEIFEDDMRILSWLRQSMEGVRFAAFGHYPTTFPAETMAAASLDFVFRGEPEVTVHELLGALKAGDSFEGILGLSYRDADGSVVNNPDRLRERDINELPYPDYSLVDINDYSEFLLPRPFAVLQTARGCPYPCNFCVRSFGQKLGLRSTENIIGELDELVARYQINSFRFIDDTFTAMPARTIEICEAIQKHHPQLVWSCLSRIDTLDEARVRAMRDAGCKRVYMGIESGSPRILKLYGKDYGVELIPKMVDLLRGNGIEVGAFFMVGHPEETTEDFELTSQLVRSLQLDYATIGQTVPYPGTQLFNQYRDQVDFSLYPYKNNWSDPRRRDELLQWEKRFYRELYFRAPYLARHAVRFVKHPATALAAGKALFSFVFGTGTGTARNELI